MDVEQRKMMNVVKNLLPNICPHNYCHNAMLGLQGVIVGLVSQVLLVPDMGVLGRLGLVLIGLLWLGAEFSSLKGYPLHPTGTFVHSCCISGFKLEQFSFFDFHCQTFNTTDHSPDSPTPILKLRQV